jgi:hypothetical protein
LTARLAQTLVEPRAARMSSSVAAIRARSSGVEPNAASRADAGSTIIRTSSRLARKAKLVADRIRNARAAPGPGDDLYLTGLLVHRMQGILDV